MIINFHPYYNCEMSEYRLALMPNDYNAKNSVFCNLDLFNFLNALGIIVSLHRLEFLRPL